MFKQILFAAVSEAIKAQLIIILAKFREKEGNTKADQLEEAIRNSFYLLKDVAAHTKTDIDDTLVDLVLKAVNRANIQNR